MIWLPFCIDPSYCYKYLTRDGELIIFAPVPFIRICFVPNIRKKRSHILRYINFLFYFYTPYLYLIEMLGITSNLGTVWPDFFSHSLHF